MRKKLVVGNWKMNLTQAEAASVVESLIHNVTSQDEVEVAVCPSYLSICRVRDIARKTNLKVGAQDVFWVDSGAFTGKVSAHMLVDAGVQLCIVGHSETRGRFGKLDIAEETVSHFAETNQTVNLKLKSLLYRNIVPILCVGETLIEREKGLTDEVIRMQLTEGFAGVDGSEYWEGVVAYEPVWAIGTGKSCDSTEASRVCGFIRKTVAACIGADVAEEVRVLYGGSVKSSNSTELFKQPDIDGGLVGGASLDPEEFCRIVMSAK